jgi:pimeloyl-ACP methyl ester carboxylesterase
VSLLNASADSATERPRLWLWVRITVTLLAVSAVAITAVVAWIFFSQHSMIYHPRPYTAAYAHVLPPNGAAIEYVLPFGKQTAYYIPGTERVPKRIWVAFCGNGSLALDWTTMLRRYPSNGDGFLLIDYPGYGRNAGYATIGSTRTTANAALSALAKQLDVDENRIELCVIGHSLGAAAALDFATHHAVQRVVLISPFTTLREEAAYVAGRLAARLVVENYDNRQNLRVVFRQNSDVHVAIFHGTHDELIPVRMARELKHEFPAADLFLIEGADHGSVLYFARDQIIAWMSQ